MKFLCEYSFISFRVKLLADRQKDIQTDKQRVLHNVLGGHNTLTVCSYDRDRSTAGKVFALVINQLLLLVFVSTCCTILYIWASRNSRASYEHKSKQVIFSDSINL